MYYIITYTENYVNSLQKQMPHDLQRGEAERAVKLRIVDLEHERRALLLAVPGAARRAGF